MKTSELLKKAKKLIADPANHLGGGRDPLIKGFPFEVKDKNGKAIKYCLMGAVWAQGHIRTSYLNEAADIIFDRSPIWVNDALGYDAAHIVLNEAIRRAKAVGD